MNERGCIYLRNSATCGLLDKDDHTYPCADLCAKNECPLRNDEKDPKCWSCQHCGDRSPLYPDFNYCKKRQENVVGHGGCVEYERMIRRF